MLYGISPFLNRLGRDDDLQPVMELQSILISIKHQRSGDAIGYGNTWHCPETMPVGMVAIGYADGYPRQAPTGTPVLVNGQRVPLIGRVSMDMLAVDLRNHPQAQIGDTVTLWGKALPVEEIASRAGTIAYQLLCNVNPRVRRLER
jgi:alanine racemase